MSTSFDNTLGVWAASFTKKGGAALKSARSIGHDNETGRWILPFRAIWAPAGDAILVGEATLE